MTGYITSRRKRILYVEDNRVSRTLVGAFFERKGYILDAVPDVIQALMKLINIKYDAIILDYHLPITSPEEAEHSLRKAKVPICFFTCDREAKSPSGDIPVINKLDDVANGGLNALESKLEELMAQPVAEDYDKTRRITEAELAEVRKPVMPTILFPAPNDHNPAPLKVCHG